MTSRPATPPRPTRRAPRSAVAWLTIALVPATGLVCAGSAAAAPSDHVEALVAGTGTAGLPRTGTATASPLNSPTGVAVDAAGTVFVADAGNDQVERITPAGVLSVVAGTGRTEKPLVGGPATASPMTVDDVAVDRAGNLYVADGAHAVVLKVDPSGTLSVLAGVNDRSGTPTPGPATSSLLGRPSAVAVDADGNVFVSDPQAGAVLKVSATGVLSTVASSLVPAGLGVDAAGNVYVAHPAADEVRRITPAGVTTTYPTGTSAPTDVAVDATGAVVATTGAGGQLLQLTAGAAPTTLTTSNGGSTSLLSRPAGLAVAGDGILLTTDTGSHRVVQLYSPTAARPHVTSPFPAAGTTGQPYTHQFTASGYPTPTFVAAGTLPAGLTLTASGLLSGTPTAAVPASFTVRARNTIDGVEHREDQTFTFTVAAPSAPKVTSPTPRSAVVGAAYSHTFTASGSGAQKWTVVGSVPAGLKLGADTGVLEGIPTTAGTTALTVTATNSVGKDTQAFTFEVKATPDAPTAVVAVPGSGSATVTWTAPAKTGSGPVTGYAVVPYRNGVAGTPVPAPAGATSATLTGLANGATYTFTVTALNLVGAGTPSSASPSIVPQTGSPVPVPPAPGTHRFSGGDRVGTAVSVSRELFPAPSSAQAVVVSTSLRYADALAGARLATATSAPLLLTDSTTLNADVAAEVRRVLADGGDVYLLGGDNALSPTVANALAALSPTYRIHRVAGADRTTTATAVADTVTAVTADRTSPIYLVNGQNFPDGLAVSALAARTGGILLLTDGGTLPASTRDYLAANDPTGTRTVPVGGPALTAAAALPAAVRARALVGADRYETARLVAARFPATATPARPLTTVGLATGANWPDALVGSAALGNLGGPLLLTDRDQLSAAAKTAMTDLVKSGTVTTGVVLGGRETVSDVTATAFTTLIPVKK